MTNGHVVTNGRGRTPRAFIKAYRIVTVPCPGQGVSGGGGAQAPQNPYSLAPHYETSANLLRGETTLRVRPAVSKANTSPSTSPLTTNTSTSPGR